MWTRTWTLAGLVADIPNVGDYFKYDLGRESFIVVRTGDAPEAIKAYYNVCHHRGNRPASVHVRVHIRSHSSSAYSVLV